MKTIYKTLLVSAVLLAVGCTSTPRLPGFPIDASSFNEYQEKATELIAKHRHFATADHAVEIEGNAPFELKPVQPNGKAVLLIHGLGDSPWTYRDFAQTLADNGYVVRAILLPGHGTKPDDMIGVTSEQWEETLNRQMELLSKEYKDIWLGGFSTGCNLALDYAETHKNVKGLILFSPAMQVRTSLIKLAPLVDIFVNWLRAPNEKTKDMGPFKYNNAPMDAIVAFKHTMDKSNCFLTGKKIDIPVVVMMTEHDSIIDTQSLLPIFDRQLTNPASEIIWYGKIPEGFKPSSKVTVRTDYLPDERIKSFAHMSLTYSPKNAWYGVNGKFRFCRNSMSEADVQRCQKDPNVWYGAWGTHDGEHSFARLTFNPYYDWQASRILKVLAQSDKDEEKSDIIENGKTFSTEKDTK